jgi:glycerol-3-phosphate dehydrogenase subunit B
MIKGNLQDKSPISLVGFKGHRDFFPALVGGKLKADWGIDTTEFSFDPLPFMEGRIVNTVSLGRAFESLAFCEEFARFITRETDPQSRIGIPAVLGVDGARVAHKSLEEITGRPVFEIPILPPSLPGRRIFQALKREFFEAGGQMINGCPVVRAETEGKRVTGIAYKAAGGIRTIHADAVVLGTGSFFSGGLVCNPDSIVEPIFNIPIFCEPPKDKRFDPLFLSTAGHPIGKSGVKVDSKMHPVKNGDTPCFENLFACGDLLGGFDSLLQRCGGGVAIASGSFAGTNAAETIES